MKGVIKLSAILALVLIVAGAASAATLSVVDPADGDNTINPFVGASFNANIAVGSVSDLLGLQFTLSYDSSVVSLASTIVNGDCGSVATVSGLVTSSWTLRCNEPTAGQLLVAMIGVDENATTPSALPVAATTDEAILVIAFTANAETTVPSSLALSNVILGDSTPAAITTTPVDGTVNIASSPLGEPIPTQEWVDFFGTVTIDGVNAEAGDIVAAYDPSGVLCGTFAVTAAGQYGFLHCYRDDSSSDIDEGAVPGEAISFKVWDSSAQQVLNTEILAGSEGNTWTANGDNWNVNLNAFSHPFGTPTATPKWVDFFGNVTIQGVLAEPGDAVAAYDPDGVLCGVFVVNTQGQYGFLHCYGDDDTTTTVDEGAVQGDNITFLIWDASTNETLSTEKLGPDTATWTAHGDSHNVDLNGIKTQEIPLQVGWNLISFSINKVYYDTQSQPSVTMLNDPSLVFEQVSSIADVLSPIEGLYDVVLGFDSQGGHTFDPTLPTFSDLHYLAVGYGYWIKMNQAGTLVLTGSRASASSTLDLQTSWNLVGFWPSDKVLYDTAQPPSACNFPADVDVSTAGSQLTSMADAFQSLQDTQTGDTLYDVVLGFDCQGGHTFDPTLPTFSDLHYVGPGYGYWIKMQQAGNLSWP